jgi:hypothetical protein
MYCIQDASRTERSGKTDVTGTEQTSLNNFSVSNQHREAAELCTLPISAWSGLIRYLKSRVQKSVEVYIAKELWSSCTCIIGFWDIRLLYHPYTSALGPGVQNTVSKMNTKYSFQQCWRVRCLFYEYCETLQPTWRYEESRLLGCYAVWLGKNRRFGGMQCSNIRVTRNGELGTALAVISNRRTLRRSTMSALTRAKRNVPEDGILHSHCREILKSYNMKANNQPKISRILTPLNPPKLD